MNKCFLLQKSINKFKIKNKSNSKQIFTKVISRFHKKQVNTMQSSKNQPYRGQLQRQSSIKSHTTQSKAQSFSIDKISEMDQLMVKNQQIYKNLRKQLKQINQAEKNITNNINVIRPISYNSREKELDIIQYEKFLYETGHYDQNLSFDNYTSSPIQTERFINQSIQRQTEYDNKIYLIGRDNANDGRENANDISGQQASLRQSNRKSHNQNTDFRRQNSISQKNNVSEPFIRKTNSAVEYLDSSLVNRTQINNKNTVYTNLGESASKATDIGKENFYFMSKSYEPYVDSIVRMNFGQLDKRKEQVQKIYQQLKQQEEQIEKSYQEYKKGFAEMSQVSTKRSPQKTIASPPKKSPPKKNFSKKPKFQSTTSKMSSFSKLEDSITKKSLANINNSSKTIELSPISQDLISENVEKNPFQPNKSSMIKYCTQEFESIQIADKPQSMSARTHIFVPFNKLYTSPILQMKHKNTLIMARQSKVFTQKSAQQKILDGKKYKFSQNVETDEQQLIRKVLREDHNMIGIVGGQATLKKKLHMAFIAHSFEKIMKIIHSNKHNCLTISLSYQQYVQKNENSSSRINKSIEVNEQIADKFIILQTQKTIEEIYEAIKKPFSPNQSTGFSRISSQINKDKATKIVRFTKLSLSFGKQCVWACHILSANQFSVQFLKNLEVKDIIWSINPLVKNYDQVSKTLNEATRYIQNRIHS